MKGFSRYYIRLKYIINEIKRVIWYTIKNEKMDIEKDKNIRIYIFLAADYRNMGDIAITYAQKKYLKDIYPENDIIEIPIKKTMRLLPYLKKNIRNEDILTIVGGGNMTNRYEYIEEQRRMVIKAFPNNKIISFPQTIEFTEDIQGQESLRRTKKIYSNHNNLVIFARENKSFEEMKRILKNNKVFLMPDIVLSLKNKITYEENERTTKIGVCLRNDKERLLKKELKKEIINHYSKQEVEIFDTLIEEEKFIYEKRYNILLELLNKISKLNLVITDRLHGMIFCYITGTPCIVFDNDNHKISETYRKWIKDTCNYIILLNEGNIEMLFETVSKLKSIKKEEYTSLIKKFKTIDKVLLEEK